MQIPKLLNKIWIEFDDLPNMQPQITDEELNVILDKCKEEVKLNLKNICWLHRNYSGLEYSDKIEILQVNLDLTVLTERERVHLSNCWPLFLSSISKTNVWQLDIKSASSQTQSYLDELLNSLKSDSCKFLIIVETDKSPVSIQSVGKFKNLDNLCLNLPMLSNPNEIQRLLESFPKLKIRYRYATMDETVNSICQNLPSTSSNRLFSY
jgi:hypothetical protein